MPSKPEIWGWGVEWTFQFSGKKFREAYRNHPIALNEAGWRRLMKERYRNVRGPVPLVEGKI